jgi:hypothetical protein
MALKICDLAHMFDIFPPIAKKRKCVLILIEVKSRATQVKIITQLAINNRLNSSSFQRFIILVKFHRQMASEKPICFRFPHADSENDLEKIV